MDAEHEQHEWFTQRIGAYVAGGLDEDERARFEAHGKQCAACGALLGEAQAEDRAMAEALASVRPDEGIEERMIGGLRQRWTRQRVAIHPAVRRAAAAVAAAMFLGTAGYVATPWIRQGRLPTLTPRQQYVGTQAMHAGPFEVEHNATAAPDSTWDSSDRAYRFPGAMDLGRPVSSPTRGMVMDSLRKRVDPQGMRDIVWGADSRLHEQKTETGVNESGEIAGQAPALGSVILYSQNSIKYKQPSDVPGHDGAASDSKKSGEPNGRSSAGAGKIGTGGAGLFSVSNDGVDSSNPGVPPFIPAELSKAIEGKVLDSPAAGYHLLEAGADARGAKDPRPGSFFAGASGAGQAANDAVTPAPSPASPPDAPPAPAPASPDFSMQRKIIRNGEMEFEVENFDSAFAVIQKIVAEEQGFVASSDSQKLPNGKMKGTIVVRVPPEHLDTLVLKLRALGELKGQRIAAQDITKQYTDLESGLRAAQAMQERLLEIIKTGKGEVKDLVAAEKELGVWREKIEQITGEIRYYNNLVALSTLSIAMTEKDIRSAASVAESEQRNIGVETEDVEKAYADAQSAIADAKGRIVEAEMKKYDAGQLAARLVCDVAPDSAGPLTDRLRQLGKVARLEIQRAQSAQGEQPAPGAVKVERKDTRFLISLYNLANVAPRQTVNLSLAVQNVEQQYQAILARVAKVGGRIVTSNLNRQTPEQTTATISFQLSSADADAVQQELTAGTDASDVQVLRLTTTDNPDTQNVTEAKRGFAVQLASLASVAPRQTISMQIAASSVSESYQSLVEALNAQAIGARVITSQLNQQDQQNVTASLDFEVRRSALPAAERALAAAGDTLARNSSRATDTENTVDSKVRLQVSLVSARRLAPRETTTLALEVADVEKARGDLQASAAALGGRTADSRLAKQRNAQVTANVVLDLPLDKASELLMQARSLGTVRSIETATHAQVPVAALTRARFDVSLSNTEGLVAADRGVWATIRNGLATSLAGLLWSLQLIVIGLLLVGPWVVLGWGVWKLVRRWRPARAVTPR